MKSSEIIGRATEKTLELVKEGKELEAIARLLTLVQSVLKSNDELMGLLKKAYGLKEKD